MRNNKFFLVLLFFICIGCVLRFFNLNWGAPFYFHPDERNIASSVSQLSFPNNLNPHFFAYGSFPLYSIYTLGVLQNAVSIFFTKIPLSTIMHVSFEQAILLSRFYSACFSLLLLLLIFNVTMFLKDKTAGFIATILGLCSVGFIQFAHFGTFEIWLTFFSFLLFYLLILWMKYKKTRFIVFTGIAIGILLAIKVSSLVLIPLVFFVLLEESIKKNKHKLLFFLKFLLLFIFIASVVFALVSPYVFLDFSSFQNSMQYESGVAIGTAQVFYTQSFFDKIPVLYQFTAIYQFLVNPFITLLFIPCFFYIIYKSLRLRSPFYLLLAICYVLLFLSQAFLFAKWTRYIVPTLPFMYCIIGIALSDLLSFAKNRNFLFVCKLFIGFLFLVSFLFAFSFFYTVYLQEDSRISAATWAHKHLPKDSVILSEVYDLGITPFNPYFSNITLFDFYDLSKEKTKLPIIAHVQDYDVIILPSQRILSSRILLPKRFPNGNIFYKNLLAGKSGFKKVYQTPCDIFCTITYMGDPLYNVENTAAVFDHPTVILFKKRSQ